MSANDNIFYDIALHLSKKNFKFIKSESYKKENITFIFYIKSKILSILNLNLNSFFYKLYKKFFFKLNFKNKKKIYIFKEIYNVENNFFKLLQSFNIRFLDFEVQNLKFVLNKKTNIKLIKKVNFFLNKFKKKNKQISKINFTPIVGLIYEKHLQVLKNFEINSKKINNDIENLSKNFKKSDIVLSNILERPLNLYFFLKLKKKIKFAFFEHGETSGYQKAWNIRKNSQPTILGNYAFFSSTWIKCS